MLLVDGVRPIDAVRTVDTLTVACPEALTVCVTVPGEVGDMVGDHVIQLGLACAVADAHDSLGVAVAAIDALLLAAPEGDPVACPDADTHDGLDVADPSPLELGVMAPDGDPVTVYALHVIRGLGETVAVFPLAVGCCDPEALGLPVGVEGRVGVSELSPLEGVGERVPHQDEDTLTVEL